MEKQGVPIGVEIKAGKKIQSSMLSGLRYWLKNNRTVSGQGLLIYGGEKGVSINEQIHAIGWKDVASV